MKTFDWSEPALEAFSAFLDYLDGIDFTHAERAEAEVKKTLARLAAHPGYGHRSRWPGLLEWSESDRSKIIVYRPTPDGIRIIGFYDARQDLSAFNPSLDD